MIYLKDSSKWFNKMAEGYIKFKCEWIKDKPLSEEELSSINSSRDKLYKAGLIGAYKQGPYKGVGFGNVSIRVKSMDQLKNQSNCTDQFLITGTATGNFPVLKPEHYTSVISFDIDENKLTCKGPIQASSESLTHAAVYLSDASANAVVHVHSKDLWLKLKNKFPTTSPTAEYGTPEIANEIIRQFKERKPGVTPEVMKHKLIIMGGHEDGIISFGKDIEEATQIILNSF
jgi:ribulose-5-phosphate 4-epimerase/fuculose-1-phosphate aldolase